MAIKIVKVPDKYGQHLSSEPIVGTTSVIKTNKTLGEEKQLVYQQEVLNKGQVIPAHKLCRLEVAGGQTLKTDVQYEFVRIDISLSVPCTTEDLEEAYEYASDWVSDKIMKAVKDAKGQ